MIALVLALILQVNMLVVGWECSIVLLLWSIHCFAWLLREIPMKSRSYTGRLPQLNPLPLVHVL